MIFIVSFGDVAKYILIQSCLWCFPSAGAWTQFPWKRKQTAWVLAVIWSAHCSLGARTGDFVPYYPQKLTSASFYKSNSCISFFHPATRMDLNNVRRVSSAGYRLPERSNGTRPITTQPPADKSRYAKGDTVQNPDRTDTVKQDQVWKELVLGERRGVREWWGGGSYDIKQNQK